MAQHAQAGRIPSCVGLDSTSQFAILYERLTAIGSKTEDYDYKNWDRSLHPEFIRAYGRVVSHWYGDAPGSENYVARAVLLEMLIQTDIIIRDKVYRKNIGICSGCAITAEINCIIHTMLVYYQFLEVAKFAAPKTVCNFAYFKANVAYAVYGDDIVISRSDDVDWFNGANIAVVCEELGMSITPADKGASVFRTKTLSECQFLKRGFVIDDDGLVKAPLELQVIKEIPEWIHECADHVEATDVNIDMAVRETFYHGRDIFLSTVDDFNRRIFTYNKHHPARQLQAVTYDYDQLDAEWRRADMPITWLTVSR